MSTFLCNWYRESVDRSLRNRQARKNSFFRIDPLIEDVVDSRPTYGGGTGCSPDDYEPNDYEKRILGIK